ncbi:hypothetical protein EXIGLDRAFT_760768 [Exidia glandulosa HHB12029]|uniref:Uncharacterized protein n=1 Tax=Exidia glandulosa HHB12029 TaxID=1314781 RepID=A0A165P2R1_EXIGL|nr:hypothetical protein EXIGLDRAFT_760768 [Exidia glandulosa HHB12029]
MEQAGSQTAPHPLSHYRTFPGWFSLWSVYDESTEKHSFVCPLCKKSITGGKAAEGSRMVTHLRNKHKSNAASSSSQSQGDSSPSQCPGTPYLWQSGSFWDSYPYHEHLTRELPWIPSAFDAESNTIYLKSKRCLLTISGDEEACHECAKIVSSKTFLRIVERAHDAKPNTPYSYLTHRQLVTLAHSQADELQSLRSKVQAARLSRRIWKRRSLDHERIMLYLAQNNIPKLRWVLTVALKRGKSPVHLLRILTQAVDGLYRARGYSQAELDISFLVSAIGGPRLLYALSRSHGLVSKRTIVRHLRVPRLRPSIKRPTSSDINTNISSLCDPDVLPVPQPLKAAQSLPGHVAMFDGIALEPRPSYCYYSDSVAGLSRETADAVETRAVSKESVDAIRDALTEKRVRFGSEATVVAIGPYADYTHYTPVPIVVSPSDKTEKGPTLAEWMETVLESWKAHQYGQSLRGPIWSLASDGDNTYRWAKHALCNVKQLDISSPVGAILAKLPGFNRYASADGLTTSTCDPKHIIKRNVTCGQAVSDSNSAIGFATLLRSAQGVILFSTNIRPADTLLQLSTLGDMSREAAIQLLDPADKQNVPKAVKLMQCLHKLPRSVPATAGELHRRSVLLCFSDVLWFFVHPFIDVSMSLEEQLESLSAFSHAADILYIKHRLACLTGPLFADTKATIKNIYVVAARLSTLDKDYRFYIILEGTDRLENEFSEVRTLDHARNFDISQLSSKLSTAFLIHAILQRNPHLDRGHRRLDLAKVMGLDRVNPQSWKGNVRVGDANLERAWANGRKKALDLLTSVFGNEAHIDFDAHYASSTRDMLRPLGDYVGVSAESQPDDMRSERIEPTVSPHITPPAPAAAEIPPQSALPLEQPSQSQTSPGITETTDATSVDDLNTGSALLPGLELDDFFPDDLGQLSERDDGESDNDDGDTPSGQSVLSETGTLADGSTFSKFFEENGEKVWKSAYIATLADDRTKKVSVRTLCAQGVTLEDLRQKSCLIPIEDAVRVDTDVVKVGDITGFLARIGTSFSLVIFEIVAFSGPSGERLLSLTSAEFEKACRDSRSRVTGQVLDLEEIEDGAWIWTGRYVVLDGQDGGTYSHKRVVLDVPPQFLHSMAPELSTRATSSKSVPTWMFTVPHIEDTLAEAWDALEPESERIFSNIGALPVLVHGPKLPYRSNTDTSPFIVPDVPAHLTPEPKHSTKDKLPCYLCEKVVPLADMRSHVGRHILRAFRGNQDPELITQVGHNPCGFCGRDQCLTSISFSSRNTATINSSCGYHHTGMQYTAAKNSKICSNIPIHCPLCPPSKALCSRTIWKYNAALHIEEAHRDGVFQERSIAQFFVDTHIERAEEQQFGIGYRNTVASAAEGGKKSRPRAPTDEADKELKPLPKIHATMSTTSPDRPLRPEKDDV